MGCCFGTDETKDDFKGYRIIKREGNKFQVKQISNTNSKSQNNEKKNIKNPINKPNINLQNPSLKLLSTPKNKNSQTNRYSNIITNTINNKNEVYYTEKLQYTNPLCETREFYTHNDFIKGEIKGKGRFGIVYCGLSSNSGEIVAIKIYDNISNLKVEKICDKIKDLYYLNHPNLIRAIPLIDSSNLINFNGKKTLSIIYEISNGDNLKDLINKFGELSEVIIQKYTIDILQGLQYLHSRNIIHKNIKSSNILVDSNGTIRISDSLIDNIILGDGKEIYDNLINGNNLLNDKDKYIDFNIPNFFIQNCQKNNFEINQSYDLWSLGCVIIECFTGKNPYSNNKFNNQKEFINYLIKNPNLIPEIPNKLSNQCKQLLNILFDYNQTSNKDIYNKIFNLDFFKMNKNLNMTNSLEQSSSIKGSSIAVNNIFNVNVNCNQKRKNSNLGQKLQKLQVVNVLNSNDNPTFSITISGISSRNSNFFLNQSQKSSFLYQSNVKGKNYNNGNNNNLKMDEVPEANVEQSPATIKDNEKNIYNFDEENLVIRKSDFDE